jgi:hypothetical protein
LTGPDVPLTQSSERTGIENNWFALTGRIVAVKVEADGDIHIALRDASGNKPGISIQMITLIDLFRLWRWKANNKTQKEKNNNESANSV